MLGSTKEASILIVASTPSLREELRANAIAAQLTPLLAGTLGHARAIIEQAVVSFGVIEYAQADGSCTAFIEEIRRSVPQFRFVVAGPYLFEAVLQSISSGAVDYVLQSSIPGELRRVLARLDVQSVSNSRTNVSDESLLTGGSGPIEEVRNLIRRYAPKPYSVLIYGETGTGKELAAREIHRLSRRTGRFVPINCGELSPTLIEAELFGHERGAFTGADKAREGLFKAADKGTIFLDEIGELPFELQSRLLRVLQEGEVRVLGSSQSTRIDVRVISATNVELEEAVLERRFRRDLLYRLNVLDLRLPPLRERPDDIPELVSSFLQEVSDQTGHYYVFSDEALDHLMQLHWPGNIRELQHVIQRVCAQSTSSQILLESLLRAVPACRNSGSETLADLERKQILKMIHATRGNREEAARRLGISKSTLYRKLADLADQNIPFNKLQFES